MWSMQIGDDFGVDHLRRCEVDIPRPGPNEVLIRVRAVSLNYRDLEVISGQYHEIFPAGQVPLSDGAGEVIECGSRVSGLQIGDPVIGCFWQGWAAGHLGQAVNPQSLGGPLPGWLQEYVCLPASGVLAYPSHLSFAQAACLPCAGLTAWQALVTEGGLQAGEWVLLQGTGGVSLLGLQIAKMHGARVVLLTSSAQKASAAEALGADYTLNYLEQPDWGNAVKQLTGGVQHVLDVGGPGSFSQSLQALAPAGQVNVVGYLGGKAGEFNPLEILQAHARVRGIAVGPRSSMQALLDALTAHPDITPIIDRTYGLDQLADAFSCLASGAHMGKLVVEF